MIRNKFFLISTVFLILASCKKEDDRVADENYNPVINPANFVSGVTNPYFPLTPGTIYKYTEGDDSVQVTVMSETKVVAGVTCVISHDVDTHNGQLVEDTYDWFAQDVDGNVWYMGEDVSNYEDGQLADHEGSWEAGVDGAKPGIIMLASPVLEMPYRQEYSFDISEDWGKVVAKNVTVITPYDTFANCLKTEDWSAIEPGIIETKYYAPGIGNVKEESTDGTLLELVDIL